MDVCDAHRLLSYGNPVSDAGEGQARLIEPRSLCNLLDRQWPPNDDVVGSQEAEDRGFGDANSSAVPLAPVGRCVGGTLRRQQPGAPLCVQQRGLCHD